MWLCVCTCHVCTHVGCVTAEDQVWEACRLTFKSPRTLNTSAEFLPASHLASCSCSSCSYHFTPRGTQPSSFIPQSTANTGHLKMWSFCWRFGIREDGLQVWKKRERATEWHRSENNFKLSIRPCGSQTPSANPPLWGISIVVFPSELGCCVLLGLAFPCARILLLFILLFIL